MLSKNPLEMTLSERKVDLVKRLFVSSADTDYLTARWAYSHALSGQFFWAAAQAVEKYMKALWLLNDKSVRGIGHDLDSLFAETKRLDKSGIIPELIQLPATTGLGKDTWEGQSTRSFIKYLSNYGSGDSRYGSIGTNMNGPVIHIVDQLAASIRAIIRRNNLICTDLFLETGQSQWSEEKIIQPTPWVLCHRLPLEQLFYRKYSVGQSDELRYVFANMNLSFFEEHDVSESIFGGLIYQTSPIINHLIYWKNLKHLHLNPTQQNTETISHLKQWVLDNIPLSREIKKVLNDPKYKDGLHDEKR